MTALCARVGLLPVDLDVAELTDGVRGFALARQVSVRGALELLAVAYHFDCAESDHQLKFKKRGRASARVIAADELVAINERGELFTETRAQDVELPARFTVRYNDVERDADFGVQTVKRIVAPAATMQSQNEATLDLPLVLTAREAKQVALRQGFSPWIERVRHNWHLGWQHIDIDPGDVVTIALEDGRSFVVRVLEIDIGANLELVWDTVVQESASYDVDTLTSGGVTYRRAIASPSAASRLLIADSPLLSDGDDALRRSSGLYWAMGGVGQPGWSGGVLFESLDAAAFAIADETTNEAAWGFCQTVLGSTPTPFQTDRVNTLTVSMTTGADRLHSVSELAMLNGANRALLIDPDGTVEVIAFATVTPNEFGSFTLSTLLRGLRGTEGFVGSHVVGALFLLLEAATLNRVVSSGQVEPQPARGSAPHLVRVVGRAIRDHDSGLSGSLHVASRNPERR